MHVTHISTISSQPDANATFSRVHLMPSASDEPISPPAEEHREEDQEDGPARAKSDGFDPHVSPVAAANDCTRAGSRKG